MDVSLFDFDLPEGLIALRPARPRDSARMLVVRPDGPFEHAQVRDLARYLDGGDALVVNDTKVIAARLRGRRIGRGGASPKIELLLHKRIDARSFRAFARPGKRLKPGDGLLLGADLEATVTAKLEDGEVEIAFDREAAALDTAVASQGEMPLPPYIAKKRSADAHDSADYQTIFARAEGSVAAPTASLHFTPELLAALAANGVRRETVTLQVGAGTFLPVSVEDTAEHRMHTERAQLTAATADRLNGTRAAGGRIVAVGTTVVRTLESATDANGTLSAFDADTGIFITPGYRFRAVDALLTNFHLPRSTLFMLVSAFSGLERMQAAYAEAIRERYRFYSYGDACLLLR